MHPGNVDHVKINGLRLNTLLNTSPWPSTTSRTQTTLHPLIISLDIATDVRRAAVTDDYRHSVDYASIYEGIQQLALANTVATTLEAFAESILDLCLSDHYPGAQATVTSIELPKALLRGDSVGIEVRRLRGEKPTEYLYTIKNLTLGVLVGAFPHEFEARQRIHVKLDIRIPASASTAPPFNFSSICDVIIQYAEASRCQTLEALATSLAQRALEFLARDDVSVTVGIAKPVALTLAESSEVSLTRTAKDFAVTGTVPKTSLSEMPSADPSQTCFAALALGSNLDDRFLNVETALRMLEDPSLMKSQALISDHIHEKWSKEGTITIIDTSFMYETAPMYVVDQPNFINCACLVETDLSSRELLARLKAIERVVGRKPGVRFGPRVVDLDIVTFGDMVLDSRPFNCRDTLDNLEGELVIPHPRMAEREFVLRPLADIVPEWRHPILHVSISEMLAKVMQIRSSEDPPMYKVMPFPSLRSRSSSISPYPTCTYWAYSSAGTNFNKKTYIMATLNATPDSFSDGSQHNTISSGLSYAASAVEFGADIIDIGGYSTRPGAAFVSSEEEIQRVVPIIKAIRAADGKLKDTLISIDTFRPEVAREAILAGANCINDVYAFSGPSYPHTPDSQQVFEQMKAVAREFAVPVIMMHSRGDAGSNKDYSEYSSLIGEEVLEAIRVELGEKVQRAIRGRNGLRRWLVMVDPGIGFSKTLDGNLQVLRQAAKVTSEQYIVTHRTESSPSLPHQNSKHSPLYGFPQLIGTSRKSFLGALLAQPSPPTNPSATKDECHEGRQTTGVEREFATAAAVACAAQQGTVVIRVHNVKDMCDVVRVASALWC